jgi:membrane protein
MRRGGMGWKEFLVALKDEISKDGVTDVAATVTYYGVLALFPFLLFLVALASVVISPQQAEALVRELSEVAPGAVTQIVGERIRQLGEQQDVTLLGFGAIGAIWAASGAVTALMRALNVAYDVEESRPFWKVRGIAVLMTLVTGALALAAGLAAVAAAPVAAAIGGPIGAAVAWLRLPFAGLAMMLLWALLYHALPDVHRRFRFITPGSVGGVILWVIASWAFSKYVANFGSYDKTYGSIGGVVVLLLWMWLSALVLLVGAEVNALVEQRSPEGERPGARPMEERGAEPLAGAPRRGGLQSGADGPARAVGAAGEGRPRLRRVAAIAAGLAAGVLLARRQT